jgi:hypothetical protein
VVVVLINKRDNGGGNNNNNKRGVLYNVHGHLAPTPGATIESLVAGLSKETVEQYANAAAKRALTWVG